MVPVLSRYIPPFPRPHHKSDAFVENWTFDLKRKQATKKEDLCVGA